MSSSNTNTNTITICANCGKGEEESGKLKSCNACHMVKYCNRECQIAHRPQHKKACKKRAAELYDEKLFKDSPPPEECPICILPLPLNIRRRQFQACCGKVLCDGCVFAMMDAKREEGGDLVLCPFCRTLEATSHEEEISRIRKLMDKGNAHSFCSYAGYYAEGIHGIPQNIEKSNELLLKAGELGCAEAYFNLGINYEGGNGLERDVKKAKHYFELAAMNGDIDARKNLAFLESQAGNECRAYKHVMIAARAGCKESMDMVKEQRFMQGLLTKDEYESTLVAHQKICDEMKSDQRDRADLILDTVNNHD